RAPAWGTLAHIFGPNRSAWVALQLKPTNWSTPPPAAGVDLAFPNLPLTKPASWSQAPHSIVMPDRLMLMLLRGNTLVQTIQGKPIDDYVVLGPAPLDDTGTASITRTSDKRFEYGEDFAWIRDFHDAERRGLAFIVPLNADDARGFDRLLVLGVKHSADEQDGQQLVERLIDNHHYSAKGFSLVTQGTATNNTDGREAGFTKEAWLHQLTYFV